jgi:hypothetical protein
MAYGEQEIQEMNMGAVPCAVKSIAQRAVVVLTLVAVISGACLLRPLDVKAKTVEDAAADSQSIQAADEATEPMESSSQDAVYSFYTPFVTKGESEPEQSLFGVQMYGKTGSDGPYSNSLIQSGADYIRVAINWERIEPVNTTPDKYIWAYSDQVLGAARDYGLTIIATHDYQPYWAASQSKGRLD